MDEDLLTLIEMLSYTSHTPFSQNQCCLLLMDPIFFEAGSKFGAVRYMPNIPSVAIFFQCIT